MAFPNRVDTQIGVIGSGEIIGSGGVVSSYTQFEDGIKAGLFCRYDSTDGSIKSIDGSEAPVIAGVVRRSIGNPIEDGDAYTAENTTLVDVVEAGIVTVEVVSGAAPKKFDPVYVYNGATTEERGKATNDSTDSVAVDGYFYRQITDSVWAIRIR